MDSDKAMPLARKQCYVIEWKSCKIIGKEANQ